VLEKVTSSRSTLITEAIFNPFGAGSFVGKRNAAHHRALCPHGMAMDFWFPGQGIPCGRATQTQRDSFRSGLDRLLGSDRR
jgi:hypothetical protein